MTVLFMKVMYSNIALTPNDVLVVADKLCFGNKVGDDVSRAEGFREGLSPVGSFVGDGVGIAEGTSVGLCDSTNEGELLGD